MAQISIRALGPRASTGGYLGPDEEFDSSSILNRRSGMQGVGQGIGKGLNRAAGLLPSSLDLYTPSLLGRYSGVGVGTPDGAEPERTRVLPPDNNTIAQIILDALRSQRRAQPERPQFATGYLGR